MAKKAVPPGLMIEYERLTGIIEDNARRRQALADEVKEARATRSLLNKLIASYGVQLAGDNEDIDISTLLSELTCDVPGCVGKDGNGPFVAQRKNGLGMHKYKAHGITSNSRGAAKARASANKNGGAK
jgi:hypothetical protein